MGGCLPGGPSPALRLEAKGAARLWQEARHPQVEVTTDSESLARAALSDSEPGFAGPRAI
jgi:hypothetical protein